ncbi:non-ribosomal peptide synthetase/type I polyketide synthase [Kitasatospora brasiliensis]|uniref:non-ribosomal peptide synthetase/type I polyketide synthase n=1 Tax=Kitasatospora brasiliensis TaxID=3058040 RepID=UPI00293020D7|nr:non-ribosomal peptide synthetase/type I polyketide synthase [Kitasatospora sp. K002]
MTDTVGKDVLVQSVREIRRLRGELEAAQHARTEPIAVVGLGCRLPGGADPEEFWEFLRRGGDGVIDFPAERGSMDHLYDPTGTRPDASYTRRAAFLRDVDQYDAAFFGVSPREAAALDPQQRLLHEVTWEALENAGIAPDGLSGSATGVYLGIANHDYSHTQLQQVAPADLEAYWATSNASTFGAGRLSYQLGLTGPSMSVDSSCSSSLVAVHLAAQSLRSGECRTALAGGVNVLLVPEIFVVLSKTRALSPDSACKTFDKGANGYVRGEGCAVLVLKRLSDARADGDRILGLIRGTAVNQDGRSSGVTVPNPRAQQDVLRGALRAGGVEPHQVGYVEAHGTGTPLGDPIELRALAAVFGERGEAGPLRVGSVKTNIGHLESAAGVAGLVKVLMALRHGEIPPHRNLTELNPEIGIDELAIEIPTELTAWPRGASPRIAGVSSFGASGTNAHVLVEEAPAPAAPAEPAADAGTHVLTLSARTPKALAQLVGRYSDRLAAEDGDLADICFTTNTGRAHLPHRLAVAGSSHAQLRARLADATAGQARTGARPTAAFLFTGQGSQYAGMAGGLYASQPLFRELIDEADAVLAPLLDRPLREIIADGALLADTRRTQPALVAVEYAVARLWMSWGVRPAALVGHSVGEIAAACVAGVMSFADGLRLAAVRGALMSEGTEPGSMAAVFASADRVTELLRPFAERVSVSAVNGPDSVVVSGGADAVAEVLRAASAAGLKTKALEAGWAFHSPLMDPVLERFEAEAAKIAYQPPRIPVVSGVDGRPVTEFTARYWRDQLRQPVRFDAAMAELLGRGCRALVEVGPAPTLLGLVRRLPADERAGDLVLAPSLRARQADADVLLGSLAELYTVGFDLDWAALHAGFERRRVALPTYPFQRERHWFEPTAPTRTAAAAVSAADPGRAEPLLGHRLPSPLETAQFTTRLSARHHPCLGDCVIDGLPVVNIGVYLESAFEAARRLNLGPATGTLVAEATLVLQGLILDPETPTDVQLHVDPDGGYRYYAQHPEHGWLLHAQGAVRSEADPAPAADGVAHRQDVRAALGAELSGQEFYARLWRRKLYLGPEARWIDRVWHGGGEAIALMREPAPGEANGYLLHPGFTDAMFQLLFICLPEDAPKDATYMLVGIDRFQLHGSPGNGPLYCHAVLSPESNPESTLIAEVRVEDAEGRTVALATGVYAKRAGRTAVLREGATDGAAHHQPVRQRPAARTAAQAPTDGFAALAAAPAADRLGTLRDLLLGTVARVLRADAATLDPVESLQNLGLDSLMALEARDALSAQFGLQLPLVAFLEDGSVDRLAEHILPLLDLGRDGSESAALVPRDGAPRQLVHDEANRYEPFGLTDLQQAYLVGRSGAYALGNISTYFFLEVDLDNVDPERLTDAWNHVVSRHDMLRAVVDPDGTQRVLPDVPRYRIDVADLRALDEAGRAGRLAAVHDEMKNQVLDASVWPVFDIRASRLDDTTTRLHVGADALTMDAWSTSVVFAEWAAAYQGDHDRLPDVAITFRDYVLALRALEDTPEHAASLKYWRERIKTLPAGPELPQGTDPALIERPEFTHRSVTLDAEQWARFKERAAAIGVTPSAAVCTAYAQVLGAWSKSSSFTLNVLFFNRLPLHPDVGKVVGNFTATTLLEVRGTASESFDVRASRLQHRLWSDLEHSRVSGVEVLRELSRTQAGSGPVTMPVVFASTVNFGAAENPGAATGLAKPLIGMADNGREQWSSVRTPQVWLDHQILDEAGGVVLNWDSVDAVFPPGLVDEMFRAYTGILTDLCADEQLWHRPGALLTPAAELDVRQAANATAGPLPAGLLHEGFTARAAERPERVAVIAADRTLKYGELDALSNRLANLLRVEGVTPGALVGVVMHKGWEQVAAVLGILKAGGVYVPIDAAVPAERLAVLLDSAGIGHVLTQDRVLTTTAWPAGVRVLAVDGPQARAADPAAPAPAGTAPDDLAYVIFTSGSTGLPKGVMIEHGAALNTVHDVNEQYGVTESDRVLALSALNFDLSVYDVFGLLSVGGAVVIPPPQAHREPARWLELVERHRVTIWNSVPMLMEMFTEHALATGARDLPVRVVMMSGDWVPVTLPDRIRRIAADAQVWSLGGATEASIWSIWYPIGEVDPAWPSVPYGKPMRNQRFHVLNESMQPCPVWVPGQLYIAGAGLARGYLGDEARTRAAFLRHPVTGERLYRTGDLGRYLPSGDIEFLGREDHQVKVQGYRIELGEIEAAMLRIPGVRSAAAHVVGGRHEAKSLVGYAVLDGGHEATEQDLLDALQTMLPSYLVPLRVLLLDALPLSANGKLDRSVLPVPGRATGDATAQVAPRDELEQQLVDIWAGFFGERLAERPLSIHDNFFELGGNSLLAVRVMARIAAHLGSTVPVSALFGHPTVERLASLLRESGRHTGRPALVPVRTEGDRTPLFFVHPVGGDVLCYADLVRLLPQGQPFYALQVPDGPELATVAELAAHYAAALTEAVPSGPYRLGGWSMGGVIALETAALLEEAGHRVELVTAIDLLEPPGPAETVEVSDADLLSWLAGDLAGLTETDWKLPAEDLHDGSGRPLPEVFHALACAAGVLPADLDAATLGQIVTRFMRNARALLLHRPRPYGGKVRLFRAVNGGASAETTERWLALLPGDAEAVEVPGGHYSVMRAPHLKVLAERLSRELGPLS